MYQVRDLTLDEYRKALAEAKKEDVVNIAMHHIQKSRELEQEVFGLRQWKAEFDKLCSIFPMTIFKDRA